MVRVLFVCLGNICRSPMAEAVFMHKVRAAGLETQISADSAGTGHWHVGETPHNGTQKVLAQHDIRCDHRARLITAQDLDRFDYVIAMDDENFADIKSLGSGSARVERFMDYAPGAGHTQVPDPFYTGGFEGVFDLVDRASDGLLAEIRPSLPARS